MENAMAKKENDDRRDRENKVAWMYATTDGDSGYYGIMLFDSEQKARLYAKRHGSAYGCVERMVIL